MLYREFDVGIGERIVDLCESIGIEYSIWNPEEILMGSTRMEIGLEKTEWNRIPICYSSAIGEEKGEL